MELDSGLPPLVHFYAEPIQALFEIPPTFEKSPPCPEGFIWREQAYRVIDLLSEWHDYRRRGRMEKNMRPSHAVAAAGHGSLGVGRFYFRVRVQTGQIFEIYYDRAPKSVDDRKGGWILLGERAQP
jgi:hypothetical protein